MYGRRRHLPGRAGRGRHGGSGGRLATDTLDANSVALSDAIASVYGEDAGAQFLELWRNHIGFFVDYMLGGATGDTAAQDEAKQKLDDYRADFGAFVESATSGTLDAETVADELQMRVDTLLDAVGAVLAGSSNVYAKLKTAADHMPGPRRRWRRYRRAEPDQFDGDPASTGSELRAGLTHLLQEHALAGLAVNQAVADGGDLEAPATANAVGALDENSVVPVGRHRLGVRRGRRCPVPRAVAEPHRLLRGLHARRRHR